MIKKFFGGIIILSAFLCVGSYTSEAKENKQILISSKESSDLINLKWEISGDHYTIYRDNKEIWTGKEKQYIDKNLTPDKLYTYSIVAYDKNNNLLNISKLNTSTNKTSNKSKTKFVDSNLVKQSKALQNNSKLKTVVRDNFITISWENVIDEDSRYKVLKNGKPIASTNENFVVDTDVVPDTTYTYEIVATNEASEERKNEINKEIKEKNVTITDNELEKLYEQNTSLITVVKTEKKDSEKSLKALTTQKTIPDFTKRNMYDFSYTTFIPGDYVKAPNFMAGEVASGEPLILFFKGDNRKFDNIFYGRNPDTSYRTRNITSVGWSYESTHGGDNMPTLSSVSTAGLSEAFSDKGITPIAKDRADADSGIYSFDLKYNQSGILWKVIHDLGMPFSPLYPNINYEYIGELSGQGLHIEGSHDNAPNHEFYVKTNVNQNSIESENVILFQHEGADFSNLIPLIGEKVYFSIDYRVI